MKIIKRNDSGWVTAIIENHWVQAKVYDEPSEYGVGGFGRVSKLSIGKTDTVIEGQNFFNQVCYHYDRGLDFDEAPAGLVEKVVAQLETLPSIF